MIDATTQRENMVESQVRPSDVTDRRIIRAMLTLPREQFVPANAKALAYMDNDLVVRPADNNGPARYLLAPRVLAKLLQLADITPDDLVLDIGCATGYSTAVLAQIADSVVGLEADGSLSDQATTTLANLSVDNAAVVTGKLEDGLPSQGPYDVIVMNGSLPEVPEAIIAQLKPGGRLVAVIAEAGQPGVAMLVRNTAGNIDRVVGFDAAAAQLPGFTQPQEFAL